MSNVFENAKIGDKFISIYGEKLTYIGKRRHMYYLVPDDSWEDFDEYDNFLGIYYETFNETSPKDMESITKYVEENA